MNTPSCDPQHEAGFLPLAARAARHGMVLTDVLGRITWVNESFEQLCGFSFRELQGRCPSELLHGPDTDPVIVARMREARAQGRSCTGQITNYHKSGAKYRVLVEAVPVHDEEQRLVRFFTVTWRLGSDLRNDIALIEDPLGARMPQENSLLPLCAWCKCVRDSQGYWHSIEDYLYNSLQQPTTSSICPKCSATFE